MKNPKYDAFLEMASLECNIDFVKPQKAPTFEPYTAQITLSITRDLGVLQTLTEVEKKLQGIFHCYEFANKNAFAESIRVMTLSETPVKLGEIVVSSGFRTTVWINQTREDAQVYGSDPMVS